MSRYSLPCVAVPVVAALTFAAPQPRPAAPVQAVEHERQTIYRSPQKPGFTCWTGTWRMPDQGIMVAFTQATGPVKGRPRSPQAILDRLSWPPAGNAGYDMNGLDLRNVYLRSSDGGKTWKPAAADAFRSCMNYITGNGQTALRDGTIVRAVWGQYLPFDEAVPQTGYLQRSRDDAKTWGAPEVFLDPKRYTTWPTRVRQLRDGRLLVLGGLSHAPAGSRPRLQFFARGVMEPLLIASEDSGRTWGPPVAVVPAEHRVNWSGEEFDVAELPGGDLLAVCRTVDPTGKSGAEVRWQIRLQKQGKTWKPADSRPAPFPHSGHPDLLAAREGVVLHLATSGIHATADAGRTWYRLAAPPPLYYPTSVQAADGRIYVCSHVGGDDAYGSTDQSIVMDTFRLRKP